MNKENKVDMNRLNKKDNQRQGHSLGGVLVNDLPDEIKRKGKSM